MKRKPDQKFEDPNKVVWEDDHADIHGFEEDVHEEAYNKYESSINEQIDQMDFDNDIRDFFDEFQKLVGVEKCLNFIERLEEKHKDNI